VFDDVASTVHRLMDSARYVTGCQLTEVTTIRKAFDDVASTVNRLSIH